MHHRLPTLLVVLALAGMGLAATTSATAAEDDACTTTGSDTEDISRISGSTRYGTAACVSQAAFPDGADTVLVARGDDAGGWADALAGTVLSMAMDAPVLLTSPDELPEETADEVRRLAPGQVVVLGGRGAVSRQVERDLASLAPVVTRISGADRAATAAEVSRRADASTTAFLVNGHRPADALVAGATAARRGAALLLVEVNRIPDATLEAFEDLGITDVVVVGGAGVVDATVADQLRARFGWDDVRRIAGPTRQETAASMARAFPVAGALHVVAAKDTSLVDAIGASWWAARPGGGPVLYVDGTIIGNGADRHLRLGGLDTTEPVRVVGGTRAVDPHVVSELEDRFAEARLGGPDAQVRGLWVHLFDDSLKTPENIDRVLNAAVSANLNTIIVQTARRHDAYYATDQIPRTTDPTMPADLDLLGTLVPAAHARGLDVHTWFSVMPTYHPVYDAFGMPEGHVHREHGPGTSEPWVTDNNDPKYAFLDPGVPGVQDHVVGMLTDVVERYDVDGIHLDYLRYSSHLAGNHNTNLARFREHGNGDFSEWRRRQTHDLARRIWLEVTAINPSVTVSMAAFTLGTGPNGDDLAASWREQPPYADKFQDWVGWLDEGIIDAVFPMTYFREARHADRYDNWVRFVGLLDHRQPVAIGIGAYLNTVGQSLAQIDDALAASDGLVVYAWQQDSSNAPQGELLRHLIAGPFSEPAPAPAPTWKTTGTDGHALVQVDDGVAVTASRLGQPSRTVVADATGHAGFVGLASGTWSFEAPGRTAQRITIVPTRVARVDLD